MGNIKKREHYYCNLCKKKTIHEICDWIEPRNEGHSHICMICGYGESWEEDHGKIRSGKFINFKYIEDNEDE